MVFVALLYQIKMTKMEKKDNYLKMLFWICLVHYNVGVWLGVAASHYIGRIGTFIFFVSLGLYAFVMHKYLIKIYNRLK
jgi:apolipoprotein N-acyltransferase